MTIVTAKWNIQDYHQMISTGLLNDRKVELICGEIIEMSPEGAPHSSSCGEIGEYLRKILGHRAKVREAHPITLPRYFDRYSTVACLNFHQDDSKQLNSRT
jgi:Uma2 family endonuclease